jgi:hypothetical protein
MISSAVQEETDLLEGPFDDRGGDGDYFLHFV